MNEVDKMVLELKKIKKGFVIFYETIDEATPANFKVFNNIFDAFKKGFYAENNFWVIYKNLEELRQRCDVECMLQDELKVQEFLGFRRNR